MQHLSTGYISPQFQLVFNDLFKTFVLQGDYDSKIEVICSDLSNINQCFCAKEQFEDSVNLIYWPPPLHGVWIDEQGCCDQKQELARQQKHTEDWLGESNPEILEIIPLNTKYDDHFSQKGNPISGG